MRKIQPRLNKLAIQAKALATRPLLIDWQDRSVKVGIIGSQVMQEIQFASVLEACEYVEQRAKSAAAVVGFGYISHIVSLPVDGYEPGKYDPDWSVVVSLNVWNKQDDLASVVMETWARNYRIAVEAKKFHEEWSQKYEHANNVGPIAIEKEWQEPTPTAELTPEQKRRAWNSGGIHPIG